MKSAPVSQTSTPLPGSMVNDETIIQQVAQRFNIQARNQETLINIRLHPAELGELKIDLTYREGAVRAHVIAQSQHVQEVLEKNMPRLRELLQGQGIQIDDIQVSAKADFVGDFDLLQEQLAKRDHQPDQQSSGQFDQEDFNETLESFAAAETAEQQGVNLTA
jgi:flagellar hook-length control protein FliK